MADGLGFGGGTIRHYVNENKDGPYYEIGWDGTGDTDWIVFVDPSTDSREFVKQPYGEMTAPTLSAMVDEDMKRRGFASSD